MTPRHGLAVAALGLGLLMVPDSQVAPAAISLVAVDQVTKVGFGDGVVVVLALGSDAKPGEEVMKGNADAIELIALNFETGQAAAVGVPRDTLVDFDGVGSKINAGLKIEGPQLMASKVAEVTGITPQYVLTTGFAGFEALVDTVGELSVRSEVDYENPDYQVDVHKGPGNPLNARQAMGFAEAREFPGDDFTRMANQQNLLQAILNKIRGQEDTEGFMEDGALAALEHLDTGLSPGELYRFAQALSQLDPAQTTRCVLVGPTQLDPELGDIVILDRTYAQQVAADAVDDGHLEPGTCRG